ncbi:MAG: hypothetical protein WC797_02760 [Candidatus Paceibacterota bacterium]|jgi:hypothetical protein
MEKEFVYKFNEGTLESETKLATNWDVGNCRRAVQYYIWKNRGKFLRPEQILCPVGYYETGTFITKNPNTFSFDTLHKGDIIYAEAIRNKRNEQVDKSELTFRSKDEYIISLHTALFTGEKHKEIWHATAVEGKSCFWTKEIFLQYYRPVAAKRV